MPTSDAYNKSERLLQLQLLFWRNPTKRIRTSEIADQLGVSTDTAYRYLKGLSASGYLPIIADGWYWRLAENAKFELLPMKLTQIHDERNEHVLSALSKLISGMPATMAPYQQALLDLARERQKVRRRYSLTHL